MNYYFRIEGSNFGSVIYAEIDHDIDINTIEEDKQEEFIKYLEKQMTAFGGGTATLITEIEYLENTEED